MTDPAAVAAYRAAFARNPCPITVKRLKGYAPDVETVATADVIGNVQGFSTAPGEAYSGQGAIPEGVRRVMLLSADLEAKGFPLPLDDGDKAVLDGQELDITDIDTHSRALAGVILFNVTGVR